jgi:two-component system response regulator DesR
MDSVIPNGRIRVILAVQPALVRGALAYVLRRHDDVEVVAEVGHREDIPASMLGDVDVLVLDLGLAGPDGMSEHVRILVLADPRPSAQLTELLAGPPSGVGFLSKNAVPDVVVDAIRRVARGEPVLDAELVATALAHRSPLTQRETEVLAIAAGGWPVREIAEKLSLSEGTVRNHLSRALSKTGACSRIQAVRIAREAGWI